MSPDPPLPLASRKILIADADGEACQAVAQALQEAGALTQTRGDGVAALRVCQADPPDLVVLEALLPKKSGLLVLEAIRRMDPSPPVVVVTSHEGQRHRRYAEALGVQGYLSKPVRADALVRLVQGVLPPTDPGAVQEPDGTRPEPSS